MKQRISRWLRSLLGLDAIELELKTLRLKLEAKEMLQVVTQPVVTPEHRKSPFRVNAVPFRKLRNDLERQTDPEFQRAQQIARDVKAKQGAPR